MSLSSLHDALIEEFKEGHEKKQLTLELIYRILCSSSYCTHLHYHLFGCASSSAAAVFHPHFSYFKWNVRKFKCRNKNCV